MRMTIFSHPLNMKRLGLQLSGIILKKVRKFSFAKEEDFSLMFTF